MDGGLETKMNFDELRRRINYSRSATVSVANSELDKLLEGISLLKSLYHMCINAGNFKNGVEEYGVDEGEVKASQMFSEIEKFFGGRDNI